VEEGPKILWGREAGSADSKGGRESIGGERHCAADVEDVGDPAKFVVEHVETRRGDGGEVPAEEGREGGDMWI
jgi:hypothetical protein